MNASKYDLLQKVPPFRVVGKVDLGIIDRMRKCPKTDPCTVWIIALAKSSRAKLAATQILDAEENTRAGILARLLESRGHVLTTAQAVVATTTSKSDDNFFFFTKDGDGVVGLASLTRRKPVLCADDDPSARGVDRILVRNLNTSWPWV